MTFQHRKLLVYAKAVEAAGLLAPITRRVAPDDRWLVLQMRRAAGSIVLNIAEGAGEFSKREKARFYRMARRSALELSGALDVVERFTNAKRAELQPLDTQLDEIAAILTTIVKRLTDDAKNSREIARERKTSRSRSRS